MHPLAPLSGSQRRMISFPAELHIRIKTEFCAMKYSESLLTFIQNLWNTRCFVTVSRKEVIILDFFLFTICLKSHQESVFIPILPLNLHTSIWGDDALKFRWILEIHPGINTNTFCSRPERWVNYSDKAHDMPGVYANMLTFLGGPRQVASDKDILDIYWPCINFQSLYWI